MERIGLCLSGGGARGPYQIGVAKALHELGIWPQIYAFSGTSIGAVNAAFLATTGVKKSEALWLGISEGEIRSTEGTFRRIIKENFKISESGVYDISALRQSIRENLNFQEIRNQRVFVTLAKGGSAKEGIFGLFKSYYRHLLKKESRVEYSLLRRHSNEQIVERLIASCSIPIVFPPVTLQNTKYYDGGVYDNVPVKPLVRTGCGTIIVAHLFKSGSIHKKRFPGVRFIEIRHSSSLGGILNFAPDRVSALISMGYHDTIEQLQKTPLVP